MSTNGGGGLGLVRESFMYIPSHIFHRFLDQVSLVLSYRNHSYRLCLLSARQAFKAPPCRAEGLSRLVRNHVESD